MRVIAGTLRGRRLRGPTGSRLRPTSDRLRETLFNILADRVVSARVLDVCAGTGALGIEALSRGAADVVFVDRDPDAVSLIARNVAQCGLEQQARVLEGGIQSLRGHPDLSDPFDLILVDPPYEDPKIGTILSAAARRLTPDGTLVLERSKHVTIAVPACLDLVRSVRAGDSVLDFYRASPESREMGT